MFDRHKRKAAVLFAAADIILTVCAFEGAYQTRAVLPLERVFFILAPVKALLLGVTLLLWVGLGRWIGVYNRLYAADSRAAVYDTFFQVFFGTLGLVTFQFLLRLDISRAFIGLFAIYNLFLLLLYRLLAGRLRGYIRRQFGAELFYVVVGLGEKAVEMARRLEQGGDYGIRLLAFLDSAPSKGAKASASEGNDEGAPHKVVLAEEPVLPGEESSPLVATVSETKVKLSKEYPVKPLSDLPEMLREHVIDEIIFAVDQTDLSDLEEIFLLCDEEGVQTRVVMDLFPHVNSHVYLDHFTDLPLLTFTTTPHDDFQLLIKRVIDVTVAAISLALLAVPMAVLAVLIRLTSKGPAIFKQVRCGLNGRQFTFYKFRSMVENAEQMRAEIEHLNEKDGPVFKISTDPRLTPLGRYLRRFSMDEWPQLWNVLKGEMSLVGPRPAVPSEIQHYKTWQRRRLRMRPGLTCLWAIRGRDTVGFDTWMKLDLEYIDNWSLWLDFKILAQTIPRVLAGKGAN